MTGPLVIGHRGAPAHRPEHTRSSFALAIEQGARAIEVDVVPSADGALVVRHDRALRSTTDVADRPDLAEKARRAPGGRREWFAEDLTAAQLVSLRARERMPAVRPCSARFDGAEPVLLLEDALRLAAEAGVLLVVELKDPAHLAALGLDPVDLLQDALRTAPRLPALAFESFEKTPLVRLLPLGHPVVYLLEPSGTAPDERARGGASYRRELAAGRFEGFAGVSLPCSLLSAPRVEGLHAAGLQVWSWTFRAENAFLPPAFRSSADPAAHGQWRSWWNALLDTGVDAVFADHPDLMVALLAARRASGVALAR